MVSVRVPSLVSPLGERKYLHQNAYCPETSRHRKYPARSQCWRSFLAKATASWALLISGSDTISINGVPARLRSIPETPDLKFPSWSDLPASSSRWA